MDTFFLLADTDPNNTVVWMVLGAIGAIITITGGAFGLLFALKSLLIKEPQKPDPDREYVTRGELQQQLHLLDTKMESLRVEVGSKVEFVRSDVKTYTDKLEAYVRSTAHEQNNSLHHLSLQLQRMVTIFDLSAKERGLPIPPAPDVKTIVTG